MSTSTSKIHRTNRYYFLHGLLILSGAAGIAYQSIWTKMFAVDLGHEIPSLFAVITAFFMGVSVGAYALHDRINSSHKPEYWYAFLELSIAVWALVIILLQPFLSDVVNSILSIHASQIHHWLIAFLLATIFLFPVTFAMGATLPAMEQAITRQTSNRYVVASAYAMNTFGAVIGVLVGTFWLMPQLGHHASLFIFVSINVFCAAAVFFIRNGTSNNSTDTKIFSSSHDQQSINKPSTQLISETYLLTALFLTGLFGIGYELLCVRTMSQIFEATIYSYATALAVYLISSTLGALFYHRYAEHNNHSKWLPRLLTALAFSCLLGLFILYYAPYVYKFFRANLGDSSGSVFISEMAIALVVFLIPSFLMGSTFSLLAQLHRDFKQGLGQALAVNTFGAAVAPAIFGLLLLPQIGIKWSITLLAIGYLILIPKTQIKFIQIVLIVLIISWVPPLQIVTLRKNETVLASREGITATATVVQLGSYRNLRVNNRYIMGGTSKNALFIQRRQAHIPLLLHADPKQALFLGVASGATVGTATQHSDVKIDAVELVPEVIELLDYFSPENLSPHEHPRVDIFTADARRFVRSIDKQYDVIIADLFHPARDGAGLLFTREHYQAIKKRLNEGGIFCHWLPFYQLNEEMIAVISRTFLEVFPDARLVLSGDNIVTPALGLITGVDMNSLKPGYLKRRVQDRTLRDQLKAVYLRNDFDLFSSMLLDSRTLSSLADNKPINTDAFPLVSYRAPSFSYQRTSLSYGRLIGLLNEYDQSIGREIIDNGHSSKFRKQLKDYIQARNQYLLAVKQHVENGGEKAVQQYQISAELSNDFTLSYVKLYEIALAMMKDNSKQEQAIEIIEKLYELRPLPKIAELLEKMREKKTL